MRCSSLTDLPSPPHSKAGWPWTEESPQLSATTPNGQPWPTISVVTPSFNQGRFIEAAIRSVLLQGYPNVEFFVIDGGSTDNTVEVIKKYEHCLSDWVSERDKGQADAVNKGWARSRGLILAWLNSDDVYAPGAFSAVARAWCESHRGPGMVYGDALSTDIFLQPYKKKCMDHYSLRTMFLGKRMPQPAVFITKTLFSRLGALNEALFYSLDFEYFLRAWLEPESDNFCYVPRVLAYSRRYEDTKCQSGGWKRVEENTMVFKSIWNERMEEYHHSKLWRRAFAIALAGLAQRHLENGSPLRALHVYKEALHWSEKVVLKMVKAIPLVFIKRARNRRLPWSLPPRAVSSSDIKTALH